MQHTSIKRLFTLKAKFRPNSYIYKGNTLNVNKKHNKITKPSWVISPACLSPPTPPQTSSVEAQG